MDTISTIIRFHNINDISLLERSLESLHSQKHVSVMPIIVTQKFNDNELAKVKELVSDIWFFTRHQEVIIDNLERSKFNDARSQLINIGIDHHLAFNNDFLAFLDYDDILYSDAYNLLISSNKALKAGVSFAYVDVVEESVLEDFLFTTEIKKPFKKGNKLDLFESNFCPIHSYVINTKIVDKQQLWFREDMSRVEDYEFLMRVGAKVPLDFSNLDKVVGLYSMRDDGSNSTPSDKESIKDKAAKDKVWKENQALLLRYRSEIEIKLYALDLVK